MCWLALTKPLPSQRAVATLLDSDPNALLELVDVCDEPAVLYNTQLVHLVETPLPLPTQPTDALALGLERRLVKLLLLLYRRLARYNPELARVCTDVGEANCLKQLRDKTAPKPPEPAE